MKYPNRKTSTDLCDYLENNGFTFQDKSSYGHLLFHATKMERFPHSFLAYLKTYKAFAGVTTHQGLLCIEVIHNLV